MPEKRENCRTRNLFLNFGGLGVVFFYEENGGAVCLSGLARHFDIAVLEKTDNYV